MPVAGRAARRPRPCALLAALVLLGLCGPRVRASDNATIEVRLRLAWGGGAPRRWEGAIAVTGGAVRDLLPLGVEADSPGALWIEDGLRVRIAEPSLRTYDGCDVTVVAARSSEITVLLTPVEPQGERRRLTIPLADALAGARVEPLDEEGNRLSVSRTPGDTLRVELSKDSLVFAPGENFKLLVQPALPEVERVGAWTLRAQLAGSRGGARLWARDEELPGPTGPEPAGVSLDVTAPTDEGVYDLTLALVERRRRLAPGRTLAERTVQFVVVDDSAAAAARTRPPDELLVEIDPAGPRWWERLPAFSLPAGLRRGPLGSGAAQSWSHPRLGTLVRLDPAPEGDASWEAYPLPGLTPGQPHLVEVEFPSDRPQQLGLSVIEPNGLGASPGLGLDSGVYVGRPQGESNAVRRVHRLPIWPRTSQPWLLVTNRSSQDPAAFGKIRVYGARPPSALTRGFAERTPVGLPPLLPPAHAPGRLWAGYLARPLVAENFSVDEGLDPAHRRTLDDWTTFFEASSRLLEYMRYAGQNALVLNVFADGSTIYPSAVLEPTPRYDSGVFFSTGQDPVRKDVLELLLRRFDGEGWRLIPALDFSSPLPELEALARAGAPSELAPVGPDGRTWLESHRPQRGLAPYYNPLQRSVQEAMLAVVQELVERYAGHPSFGGVVLQLSPTGFAQAPGPEWGLDDQTLREFARETAFELDSGSDEPAELRAGVLAQRKEQWLNWRAARLTAFYAAAQQIVADARPDCRLLLAPLGPLPADSSSAESRALLLRQPRSASTALEVGLDLAALRRIPGLMVLEPHLSVPLDAPSGSWAQAEAVWAFLPEAAAASARPSAALLVQHPQRFRSASFAARSPVRGAAAFLFHTLPAGDDNRKRLAHALAQSDVGALFDGGWMLPLGQEEPLRGFVSAFRALPPERFEPLAETTQPVVIRTFTSATDTYAYLVNDSPWRATVSLQVLAPANCQIERLGLGPQVDGLPASGAATRWAAVLEPYELLAVRCTAPGVRFSQPRVQVEARASVELEEQVLDLAARAAALERPRELPGPPNAQFEAPPAEEPIPGWRLVDAGRNPLRAAAAGVEAQLVADAGLDGKQAVRFASGGPAASLVSAPFPAPASSRLFLRVLLRAQERLGPPRALLAVEQSGGEKFTWSAPVGTAAAPLGDRWHPYLLRVEELPANEATALQVRIDLEGPGEVWIDDVQILDPPFTATEHAALRKLIKLAEYQLEQRQFADCARFVDGFWAQYLRRTTPAPPLVAAPPPPAGEPAAQTAGRPPSRSLLERWRGAWRWW